MNILKKVALLLALAVIALVDIVIYWNFHVYYQAKKIEDNGKKIEILEKINQFFLPNDLIYYELGKAYFDLGINSFDDNSQSNTYLRRSVKNFNRSIKINPASQFSHFNLAQSLLYLSTSSPSFAASSYDEYKKSVLLVGENSQIFFEIGKVFFSRWSELSDEDRNFSLGVLKSIMNRRDREKILSLFHIWEMNVKDYEVMGKILPENARIYQMYAKFLGEKSLSLDERQRIIARAELLEFEEAKNRYNSGENEFFYYQLKQAFSHFNSCLNTLKKIRFYQNLTQRNLISRSEYNSMKKSTFLNLAKCRLEEGAELLEVASYLQEYLALEDKVAAVSELESFLKERALIDEKFGENFDDFGRFSFQLYLYFKQNRYREIMRIGRLFEQSFVVVPKEKKDEYVRVLQLMGDSYQKIDYLYDAGDLYQKALEIDAENLETMLKIRRNFERLNEAKKIREIDKKIEKILAPKKIDLKSFSINKSRRFSRTLILDGRKIILDLSFKDILAETPPLISVFFNGNVVWEDYLKEDVLSLSLESKLGRNSLQVVAVNKAVSITGLRWRNSPPNSSK